MSYIRKSNDMIIDVRNNPMGDPGSIISQNLANSDEELLNKRRMFKKNTRSLRTTSKTRSASSKRSMTKRLKF